MAKLGALLTLVATTTVVLLLAGDHVDAEYLRTGEQEQEQEQVLTFYIPGPSKIIAGPGSGTNNMSESAFGTLAVYDVPIREGLDDSSTYYGQCRGFFLVDSVSGTNIMMFFTLDLTSNAPKGSLVVSGSNNLLLKENVAPIVGGSGDYSSAKGYVVLQPILPESTGAPGETLDAVFYTRVHYTLPNSNPIRIPGNQI